MRFVKIKKIKKGKKKTKKIIPKQETNLNILPKLKPIKKIGYWCEYYPGRLPFPIECSYNKKTPISYIFKNGKRKRTKNMVNCPKCTRYISWEDWKKGKWNNIIKEIKKGVDLRNEPSPFYKDED